MNCNDGIARCRMARHDLGWLLVRGLVVVLALVLALSWAGLLR